MIEAAIHQYKGDDLKTEKWLKRFTNKSNNYLNQLKFGEFLYFTGSKIEIIPWTTRSYTNTNDY